MRRIAAAVFLAGLTLPAFAIDHRVDINNNTGTENGSAINPYRSVQAAVSNAANGDRVLVAQGTYNGVVRIENKSIEVMGGFEGGSSGGYSGGQAGDFTTRDIAGNVTILQGTPSDSVVLMISSGLSELSGFTIRGGGGANEDEFRSQGGGIFVMNGSPKIFDNIIENNDARDMDLESFGGAIFSTSAAVTIEDNLIRNNQAGRGAGVAVSGGNVVIRNNSIVGNIANGDHGGGLYIFSPNAEITGNQILQNEVGREIGYGWGGGIVIFNPGANATIRGNRIYENYSPSRGPAILVDEGANALIEHCLIYNNTNEFDVGAGAIYVDPSFENVPSTATIRHCTIFGHETPEAPLGGNGLFVEGTCTVNVENSIFWNNDGDSIYAGDGTNVTVTYSTTEESFAGTGNLTSDPLFADPSMGDFHLRSTQGRWNETLNGWVFDAQDSPAIDAANPASPFDVEPNGNGGRANQGAYGNTSQASRTSNPDQGGTGWFIH